MRTHRSKGVAIFERLEDRSVPSLFGLFGGVFGGNSSIQAQDARQVQRDFNQFQNTVNLDVRTILYGADANGNINPAANRAAFNTAVHTALATLATSLTNDVSNLAASNPSLSASTISAEITGATADSLQAQLDAVATPSGVFTPSARSFRFNIRTAIDAVESPLLQAVRTATLPTTTPPATPTALQALPQVRQAFSTFQASYNNDVQTVLYKADATGNVNPATNRAAFDAQVATDLATLSTSVHTALNGVPNNTALLSQLDAVITGSGSDSLKTQLANLPTPTGAFTFSTRLFRLQSNFAIALASQVAASDIQASAGVTTHVSGGGFFHRHWF
ncbi:MAG: hypothetical protein JWN86_4362 [Planctomycetota bacterium]|nr:hypothetical protein [Planctomycetota bacterium]